MSSDRETIYVALLDEGIDVWRPVAARKLAPDTYLILDQNYDRKVETGSLSREPSCAVAKSDETTIGSWLRPKSPLHAIDRYTEELITLRDARVAWHLN